MFICGFLLEATVINVALLEVSVTTNTQGSDIRHFPSKYLRNWARYRKNVYNIKCKPRYFLSKMLFMFFF